MHSLFSIDNMCFNEDKRQCILLVLKVLGAISSLNGVYDLLTNSLKFSDHSLVLVLIFYH